MTPPPAPPIRVLIADDHPVVRQGLRTFLGIQDDIEVVGEAEDGTSAVTMAAIRSQSSRVFAKSRSYSFAIDHHTLGSADSRRTR